MKTNPKIQIYTFHLLKNLLNKRNLWVGFGKSLFTNNNLLQVPPPQVSNRGRLDRVEQFKQLNNSIDSIEERKIIIEDASNSEFYKSSLRVNIESPKQARWLSVLKIENARKRSKSMNSNILNNNIFNDSKVVESKYYLRSEDLENIKLNCY